MVVYDNLFDSIINFDNLYDAYIEARRRIKYKPDVLCVSEHIEEVIENVIDEIHSMTWTPDKYKEFEVRNEVKRRIIHAPSFRDRIIHHAIVRIVGSLFVRKFIFDSYASLRGKGAHRAVNRLQHFMRCGNSYALQCDISKYFPSINHDVLKRLVRRTIADKQLLSLLDKIIDSHKPGVPIGSLTSQLFANVVLNELDHYIKDVLREKYYIRYMDDFIILHRDKQHLVNVLPMVESFLNNELQLRLNKKTVIKPISHGIDFVGYRVFTTHILPRKRNIKAAKKRFKYLSYQYKYGKITLLKVKTLASSFLGYVSHCNARVTTKSTLKYLVLRR